jgi:Zn-dependent protease
MLEQGDIMENSVKFGKLFGVEIGVHWSWLLIFAIVTYTFATGIFETFYEDWSDAQKWAGGAAVSIIFFLSVLAHELSHAIVSNRLGLPVKSITLFVFGGVANLSRDPDDAKQEFLIAVVGPITSLVLGILFGVAWAALYTINSGIAGIALNLAIINVSLAVFNMLPGFPLDGGRVFRSLVWLRNKNRLKATKSASTAGEWIAYALMAGGMVQVIFGYYGGLWMTFIGFFLKNAASGSYQQTVAESALSGVLVRDVMSHELDTVEPTVMLDELLRDHMLRRNSRCFAVIAAGDFAGIVTLSDVRAVEQAQWPEVSVYRAMTPATKLHTVSPDESIMTVMRLMSEHDVNQLPVVQGRELVGMLTRADVMRFIQLRQDVGDLGADQHRSGDQRETMSGASQGVERPSGGS